MSKGKLFKNLVWKNKPLQILGTINAYCAMMAEKIGAQAIYLSGMVLNNLIRKWCCYSKVRLIFINN
jgi:methylisocitrate lyase